MPTKVLQMHNISIYERQRLLYMYINVDRNRVHPFFGEYLYKMCDLQHDTYMYLWLVVDFHIYHLNRSELYLIETQITLYCIVDLLTTRPRAKYVNT